MKRHAASDYEQLFQRVLRERVDPDDTALFFYDIRILADRVDHVREAFPPKTRHAVAVKANPVTSILRACYSLELQAEAASFGEYHQARRIPGFGHIVYDSPAKTAREMEVVANDPRVTINLDSLNELALLPSNPKARIGLRINPQVGSDSDANMSVAGTYSKFGFPIARKNEVFEAFEENPSLSGLHVHTSSQAHAYDKMVAGIRAVLDLFLELQARFGKRMEFIDIGGGFPVDYGAETKHEISAYGQMLKSACPELWTSGVEVITEFGRYYHAHAGFSLAQVQGVKSFDDHQVLITHLGADTFVRESYSREKWPHQFYLLNAKGELKNGPERSTDLGGPLCFGGDFYGKEIGLPAAEAGDWVVIADTGANSYSLWSHHCSRPFPKLFLVTANGTLIVGKKRQDILETARFWD